MIKVYNAGPNRVTVNEGWFEAKDRTRVDAFVPRESSLAPGDRELLLTAPRDALTATHDEHGGIVKMCVLLAGRDKPAEENVRDGWIDAVRALQDRD